MWVSFLMHWYLTIYLCRSMIDVTSDNSYWDTDQPGDGGVRAGPVAATVDNNGGQADWGWWQTLAMCGNGSRDQRPGHLVLPQSWGLLGLSQDIRMWTHLPISSVNWTRQGNVLLFCFVYFVCQGNSEEYENVACHVRYAPAIMSYERSYVRLKLANQIN